MIAVPVSVTDVPPVSATVLRKLTAIVAVFVQGTRPLTAEPTTLRDVAAVTIADSDRRLGGGGDRDGDGRGIRGCRRWYRSESDARCGDRKSAEVVFEWLCAFSSMAMRVQSEPYYTITSGIPLLLPSATTCIRTLDELLAKQCCQTTFTLQADRVGALCEGFDTEKTFKKVLFHDEYRRLGSCLLPAILSPSRWRTLSERAPGL
ncbi:MAG: hypothetical protein JWN27_1335 [Candidatus Eremiobacteraeota bacterium]|nr:hypothetical protein [Candidatus Eremiobacteraeota bacterium]